MEDKAIAQLVARLEKLERVVFSGDKKSKRNSPDKPNKYKGATGGIRLLVDEGFLDNKRSFSEICKKLENKGYHYSKQAIQTPLNRLAKKERVLVALTEKGKKIYVKRK